jgi:hypothetical protein
MSLSRKEAHTSGTGWSACSFNQKSACLPPELISAYGKRSNQFAADKTLQISRVERIKHE